MAERDRACGYRSAEFAASHAHEGRALELPQSGGWLVRRAVPGDRGATDAIACYPLLCCGDWGALPSDLAMLDDVVTVTAVVDPMAPVDEGVLRAAFPDLLRPYKEHQVVDLRTYELAAVSGHHRRNVARGHRRCRIERVDPPVEAGDDWVLLYDQLRARHGVTGRADLPDAALRQQLQAPGAVVHRADVDGVLAGIVVWMVSDGVAYYHLGAYSAAGYQDRAAYALFDVGLRELADLADVAVLGSSAGDEGAGEDDGLLRFKRGWGTFERTAHLAGRIVDAEAYERLAEGRGAGFFPAYRASVPAVAASGERS